MPSNSPEKVIWYDDSKKSLDSRSMKLFWGGVVGGGGVVVVVADNEYPVPFCLEYWGADVMVLIGCPLLILGN